MAKSTEDDKGTRGPGDKGKENRPPPLFLAPEQLSYARRRLAFLEQSDLSLLCSLLDSQRLTTQLYHDAMRAGNVVRRETQRGETRERAEEIANQEVLEPRDQLGFTPAAADMDRARKLLAEWKRMPEAKLLLNPEP